MKYSLTQLAVRNATAASTHQQAINSLSCDVLCGVDQLARVHQYSWRGEDHTRALVMAVRVLLLRHDMLTADLVHRTGSLRLYVCQYAVGRFDLFDPCLHDLTTWSLVLHWLPLMRIFIQWSTAPCPPFRPHSSHLTRCLNRTIPLKSLPFRLFSGPNRAKKRKNVLNFKFKEKCQI